MTKGSLTDMKKKKRKKDVLCEGLTYKLHRNMKRSSSKKCAVLKTEGYSFSLHEVCKYGFHCGTYNEK